jgi:hypothetical protein
MLQVISRYFIGQVLGTVVGFMNNLISHDGNPADPSRSGCVSGHNVMLIKTLQLIKFFINLMVQYYILIYISKNKCSCLFLFIN